MFLAISDLHNLSIDLVNKLKNKLGYCFKEKNIKPKYLLICGDICNKGKIFESSILLIKALQKILNINKQRTFICPGNHDIDIKEREISKEYMNRINELTIPNNCIITETVNLINNKEDNFSLLIANSCFHNNHKFGEIDLEEFKKKIEMANMSNKILMLHHHILPIDRNDNSHLSNSYGLIKIFDKFGLNYIIHGHRHSELKIKINGCKVIGVGALGGEIEKNVNYQVCYINGKNEEHIYRYFSDLYCKKDGTFGEWKEIV
jgi:predicted MPP superfamily phosphohydrolase